MATRRELPGQRWLISFAAAMVTCGACSSAGGASDNSVTVAPVSSGVVRETLDDTSTDISVSLPELSDADSAAAEAFLNGPGAPLKVLLDVARSLSEDGSPRSTDCDSALNALAAGPSPAELAELAGQVPDPVLSAAFVAVVTATDEYVTRCTTGEDLGDSELRLADAVLLADTRIADL